MQFQIPQFIETEDKIVGPFSLRQFIYAGGGIGMSALFYFVVSFWAWLPFAIFFTTSGIALAFIKVNGRSLPATVFAAASYFWQPRQYVWQPNVPQIQQSSGGKAGFSLENVVAGLALSSAWQKAQTGTISSNEQTKRSFDRLKEKYQVFSKLSGEREAAKRVDY